MSYNLPPPTGDPGVDHGPGLGGLGPGLGGFPGIFPGFGKSFNFDVGGGFGFPGLFGGGFPGWGGPYLPVTPLGSLWGFKGDLIVPIVAIGVALFILLLIVLAVKYALAWKLQVLDDLAGPKGRRDIGQAPAEHLETDNLNRLTDIVAAAIYSEGCSRRILCEIGAYAREGRQYPSLIRLMELVVPEEYHQSFVIVRQSAEGKFDCAMNYPCGNSNQTAPGQPDPSHNEIDGADKIQPVKLPTSNQTTPAFLPVTAANAVNNNIPGATPAPTAFGKFKRAIFN